MHAAVAAIGRPEERSANFAWLSMTGGVAVMLVRLFMPIVVRVFRPWQLVFGNLLLCAAVFLIFPFASALLMLMQQPDSPMKKDHFAFLVARAVLCRSV